MLISVLYFHPFRTRATLKHRSSMCLSEGSTISTLVLCVDDCGLGEFGMACFRMVTSSNRYYLESQQPVIRSKYHNVVDHGDKFMVASGRKSYAVQFGGKRRSICPPSTPVNSSTFPKRWPTLRRSNFCYHRSGTKIPSYRVGSAARGSSNRTARAPIPVPGRWIYRNSHNSSLMLRIESYHRPARCHCM